MEMEPYNFKVVNLRDQFSFLKSLCRAAISNIRIAVSVAETARKKNDRRRKKGRENGHRGPPNRQQNLHFLGPLPCAAGRYPAEEEPAIRERRTGNN